MKSILDAVAGFLVQQSWQIPIVVGLVVLACWVLRNATAHWRYLLWMVVIAKCLMPPLVNLPLPVLPVDDRKVPLPSAVHVTASNDKIKFDVSIAEIVQPSTPITEETNSAATQSVAASSAARAPIPLPPEKFSLRQWLVIGWLLIVGLLIFQTVGRMWSTSQRLKSTTQPADDDIQSDVAALAKALGMKKVPYVHMADTIAQPFVWGWLRGDVYLPFSFSSMGTVDQRHAILTHELAHVHRWDAALNHLQNFVQALFFFHPLVWWTNQKIRQEREKCCDEIVLSTSNVQPKDYCEAIVGMLALEYASHQTTPALAVTGSIKNVKERITTMLSPNRKFCRSPSRTAVVAVLLVAASVLPTAVVMTPRIGNAAAQDEPAANLADDDSDSTQSAKRISGSVVTPDSAPVVGAEVRLLTWNPNATRYTTKIARTDTRGEFSFEDLSEGKHRIAAYFQDSASRTKRYSGEHVVPGQSNVVLSMQKAPSLNVRVLDRASQQPIEGARVRLTWTDTERDHLTDADGVITLRGLTSEVWTIEVQGQGYAEQVHAMNLLGPTVSEVTAMLDPGVELAGTIRDDAGKPLPDVGISVFPGGMSGEQIEYMTTDEAGEYSFEYLPRSSVTLLLSKDDYQPLRKEVALTIQADGRQMLDLTLLPRPDGGSVAGTVVDAQGVPIVGAKITNHGRSSRDVRATNTDINGVFQIDNVFQGTRGHEITIEAKGFAPQDVTFVPGSKEKPANVTAKLEPGYRAAGTIVDEKGVKLAGVRVTANGASGSGIWSRQSTTSDANGRFEIDSLPKGSPLDFSKDGYSAIQDKVLPRDGTEEVIIKMLAEGVIRGIVIDDESEEPLAQFTVRITFSPDRKAEDPSGSLSGPRAFQGEQFTSTSGEFELHDLIQGMPLQVTAEAVDYNPRVSRRVVATAANSAEPIEFRLTKVDESSLFKLAGQVTGENSQPIAGVELRLIVTSNARAVPRDQFPFNWQMLRTGQVKNQDGVLQFLETASDNDGRFAFTGVKLGSDIELVYWGEGIAQDRKAGLEMLNPAARGELSISAVAAGVVRGKIDAAIGKISNVLLSGNSDFFRAENLLADASYEVKNVPPGTYELQVYGPEIRKADGSGHVETHVIKRIPVQVKSGQTQVIDIGPGD